MMKTIVTLILILAVFSFSYYLLKMVDHYPQEIDLKYEKDFFGITYSKKFAEDLELDWKTTYLDILDDLNVRQVRIPVYWDQVEIEEGVFDFSDYDFLIEEGAKRDVDLVLNIGLRTARWPECHFPAWVDINYSEDWQKKTLKMLEESINHFKKYDSIKYWQLENEPLLNSFGICPKGDYDFLKKELKLLKELDSRPVIITATGELSFWNRESKIADIFGTTMYRVVHNPWLGYIRYPYSSKFYSSKAKILGLNPENVYIMELQAEPWIPKEDMKNILDTTYQESFNIHQFKANAQIAINTGFSKAYLWGAEWWYFKHKEGNNSEYWDFAKTLFK